MKMVSYQKYQKTMEERKAFAEEMKNKKNLPDLFLPKVGEQIQVQFVNTTTADQAGDGLWCHFINMKSKNGNDYQLKVPCLSANAEEGQEVACPLCERGKHLTKDHFNNDVDEGKTTFITPYILVNMNMEWNKTAKKFTPITDMQVVDGKNQLVEIQPQLCKLMCAQKTFRDNLIKFIEEQGGNIANKVITIQGVYMDKNGNITETGEKFNKRYVFAINEMIDPVDTSQFDVPEVDTLFAQKTAEDMDLFIHTGKWYLPKDQEKSDVIRQSDIPNAPQNPVTPSQAQQTSAPEQSTASKYENVPGVTFMQRD